MGITEITLYNLLRKKMGEQETYELMQFIHSEVKAELDMKTNVFLIKDDKAELIQNAKADKVEMMQQGKADKVDLIGRINLLREEMTKLKIELIRWIVGLAILQYILLMLTKKFF